MRITGGQVFTPAGFQAADVCTAGERIAAQSGDDTVFDAKGCYVIPGLTDLHFHGAMGADFSDGDADGFQKMAEFELSQGVTQICPAGMTLLEDQLVKICKMAADHNREGRPGAMLVGVNLEGPFLSHAKKGAQNGDWLQDPNLPLLKKLYEASDGLVKLVSVAPELPGAIEFIREASKMMQVSLAHSAADYDTAAAAYEAGARQATHFYNAMPPFTHRAPGIIGAAAERDDVFCELISDGVHIHPSVVRCTFRMVGKDRMILISDTMRACGMPDGQYTLGGQDVIVKGPLATLKDGTIAGSATCLMDCVRRAVSFGIPLVDAITAAAVNPARALKIDRDFGTLDVGKMANIVVLDENLALKQVFFRGKAA